MKQNLQFLLCFLLMTASLSMNAQNKLNRQPQPAPHRCATEEAIQQRLLTDPQYRAWYEQSRKQAEAAVAAYREAHKNDVPGANGPDGATALTSIVTIPTVVHIVLPNPEIITDADVEYFINRLNLDFSGDNPDSTNGVAFYSVRGRSLLRFCLAKRDPSGNFTTGIERRVGTAAIGGGEPQAIKSFAAGGLNSWDHTRYYNMWTGLAGGGLLGIAPEIGVGTAASDGVCVNYQAFANNPCYTIGAFNLARTAVHEIGHNFGLWHTFQGGCGGTDMGQLTSPSCQLSATILALPDDTPAQNTSTSGCPTGTISAGCASSPNPPGRQYQNYMDYTDDACYSMFSKTQVERMHALTEFCRAGYLTSNGCQLPAGTAALDVSAETIVAPGGSEVVGCNVVSYPVPGCPGSVVPKLKITNRGSTNVTSVTVNVVVTGANPSNTTNTISITSLAYGKSTVVTLPAINVGLGANNITFNITQANGAADANPANNSLSTSANVAAPPPIPVSHNFVAATPFVPAGWSVVNPNGNNTWLRSAQGNLNVGSAFIDNYNFNLVGQTDDIRTPNLTIGITDSVIIEFDLAHKNFPGFNDRMQVLVSNNCGASFTVTSFDRSGAALATAGSSTANYTAPAATDWRKQRIAIGGAILASGTIQVVFRNICGYGNNVFIDNINILKKVDRDLSIDLVSRPVDEECVGSFAPSFTVKNNGAQTVTSYQVGYIIGTGAPVLSPAITTPIASGATAVYTFAPISPALAAGNYSIRAYTANPVTSGGSGDQSPSNDTSTKAFLVKAIFAAPFSQGFESPTFPPAGWAIFNPNANITWVRTPAGKNSSFGTSIDCFSNPATGQIDDIRTPPINTAGADSLVVTFDLAHKNYPGFDDRVAVGASGDCGATFFATSYNKAGTVLATAGSSTAGYTNPAQGDWRNERVAIGGAALANGYTIVAFRCVNGYGNYIHLDNINFRLKYRRDIGMRSIVKPNLECAPNFTPSVSVINDGSEAITAVTVVYSIDGGSPVSTTITGLNIQPGAVATLSLPAVSGISIGSHSIRIYSTNLVTSGGSGDQNLSNDTITRPFTVFGTGSLPLSQDFEGTFVPTGWGVSNPDIAATWAKANTGAGNSGGSAVVKNFTYTNAKNERDELVSPLLAYSNVDSVYLSFDVSAITRAYPGSTTIPLDTLEVLVTKDCGNTYTSIWKKWGPDLQTINDPNYSNTFEFVPGSAQNWKKVSMNITRFTGVSATGLQFVFRNTSNADNNVYVDNINVKTLTLPQRLKAQGYLIYPSPFTSTLNIQHFLPPTDLRYVEVFNARGQLVARQQFGSGGASSNISMNLSTLASGVYTVKLGYTNKQIVERIVKAN
jgi:hypothetical protein